MGYFLCISCVSLLIHNLATGLMEQVRTEDGDKHKEEHSDLMLNTLADMVSSKRHGGPIGTLMHFIVPTCERFLHILLSLKSKCRTAYGSYISLRNVESTSLTLDSTRLHVTRLDSDLVPMHEDHYFLMSTLPEQ